MATDLSRNPEIHPVGYEFAAHDGGYNPFEYWESIPIKGIHCPDCYSPLDHETISTRVEVRGRSDVFNADGHLIVTERFRDFCLRNGYDDVEFPCVDRKRPLFELRPTRILDVDVERSKPIFCEFCMRCGNFECYLYGQGLYLQDVNEPLPDGFYRTDLIVGCRSGKHPIIIVAPETRKKIIAEKFTRLYISSLPLLDDEFEKRKQEGMDAILRHQRELRAGRPWRPKGSR